MDRSQSFINIENNTRISRYRVVRALLLPKGPQIAESSDLEGFTSSGFHLSVLSLQPVSLTINSLDEIVGSIRVLASIAVIGSALLYYHCGLAHGRAVVAYQMLVYVYL
jgi:hypothetical protein